MDRRDDAVQLALDKGILTDACVLFECFFNRRGTRGEVHVADFVVCCFDGHACVRYSEKRS